MIHLKIYVHVLGVKYGPPAPPMGRVARMLWGPSVPSKGKGKGKERRYCYVKR